ncbi:uncharacterized protein RSE6_08205 [Rhynchosporium secalis]|uniref:Uncharacterized protein n=1 Tax=Rhynchosporium secalis TaxID=38038 RepID=A0A1E1MEU3_RHYSE|nr:uncharacterized protein RSE6_08205 [Rhynchosporium secalis]
MAAGWSLLCRIIDPGRGIMDADSDFGGADSHRIKRHVFTAFRISISTPDMSSNYPDWRMKTRHNNRNVTCRCQRSHHIPHYGIMGGVALNALS